MNRDKENIIKSGWYYIGLNFFQICSNLKKFHNILGEKVSREIVLNKSICMLNFLVLFKLTMTQKYVY